MSKTCEDCGNATCVCEGIGKMLTEAKCGTCGRDMNDAYNRLLCREHFTASIAALTSELAESRAERAMFCALVESLTSERDEARAERDSLAETRGALTANLNALTIALGESRSELAEARRMLAEAIDERDAYRDGRYAGPWQPVADHHNGEGYSRAGAAFVGLRRDGRYEWNCAGFKSALVETAAEAKAAADAHLIAAGWWLDGGPHKAGEAK